MDENSLQRFIDGQGTMFANYERALNEIKIGKKESHWIWYIFPQLRGLGTSRYSHYYGIADLHEAELYLSHPILGVRLREIAYALIEHEGKYPEAIFGCIDAQKVKSCMTLFDCISPHDIVSEASTFFTMENEISIQF